MDCFWGFCFDSFSGFVSFMSDFVFSGGDGGGSSIFGGGIPKPPALSE